MIYFIGKRELIRIHTILFKVKEVFELAGIKNEFFTAYDDLDVLPVHVFKKKEEHKRAVLLLCLGLLKAIRRERILEEFTRTGLEMFESFQF